MLEIKNLSFSYDNNVRILDDLDVVFDRGQTYAIIGESGEGKSTLLSVLAGLDNRYEGIIKCEGSEIKKSKLKRFNQDEISIIFQDNNLLNYMSIIENIKQGCIVKKKPVNIEVLSKYLSDFNLKKLNVNAYPNILSGGQQQRIAIIRSLISNTSIILADEPTANLDKKNANIIIRQLQHLAKNENKIVIIVTHSNEIAKRCDVKYRLMDGKLENIAS